MTTVKQNKKINAAAYNGSCTRILHASCNECPVSCEKECKFWSLLCAIKTSGRPVTHILRLTNKSNLINQNLCMFLTPALHNLSADPAGHR